MIYAPLLPTLNTKGRKKWTARQSSGASRLMAGTKWARKAATSSSSTRPSPARRQSLTRRKDLPLPTLRSIERQTGVGSVVRAAKEGENRMSEFYVAILRAIPEDEMFATVPDHPWRSTGEMSAPSERGPREESWRCLANSRVQQVDEPSPICNQRRAIIEDPPDAFGDEIEVYRTAETSMVAICHRLELATASEDLTVDRRGIAGSRRSRRPSLKAVNTIGLKSRRPLGSASGPGVRRLKHKNGSARCHEQRVALAFHFGTDAEGRIVGSIMIEPKTGLVFGVWPVKEQPSADGIVRW